MSRRGEHPSRDPVLALGRRCLPWLLGGAVLGVPVGVGLVLSSPPIAHATTVVELTPVTPVVDLAGLPLKPVSVDTDAQLLSSDEVVGAAAAATGRTPAQARRSLSVSAEQLTRVVNITYTDARPKAAQAGAERAAEVFLTERQRLVLAPVRASLERLGAVLSTDDPAAPAPPPVAGTAADLATPAGRQQAAVAAELALTGPGIVLRHALALPATDRGGVAVPVGSAVGGGALLALGVGLLRDRSRVRHGPGSSRTGQLGDSAEAVTAIPAPGALPGVPPRRRSGRRLVRPLAWALVCGLAGLGAGLAASSRVDARPVGEARVVLEPLAGNAFSTRERDTSVDLKTEAQAVTADAVLAKVLPVSSGTVLGLRNRVTAKVVAGSEVLSVSVRGEEPARAVQVARAVAQASIDVRKERTGATYADQAKLLQTRIADTQNALTRALAAGGDASLAPVYSERLVALRESLRSLPTDVDAGGIVDTSTVKQHSRALLRDALPAAAALLAAAMGLLLGRHRTRPEGRSPRRPGTALGRPVARWS